jgi:sulfate adenylyltransferase subunit 2
VRDAHGQWDPKNQRPELWDLYNGRVSDGETVRAFPLSNWTELDVWQYIRLEQIPIVPLYFARERPVIRRNGVLIPQYQGINPGGGSTAESLSRSVDPSSGAPHSGPILDRHDKANGNVEMCLCRFRSLGCIPCTGAVASSATSIDEIIAEVAGARTSEREHRVIDLTSDSSMEHKKQEGYF